MPEREYREKLYREYLSRIEAPGREVTRAEIEKQFPVWDARYRRLLPGDRSARIIDIGCGRGGFVHYLRRAGYTRVAGVDLSEEQAAAARALGIPEVVQGDFREVLGENPGVYGAVIARDVLEHFPREETLGLLNLIREALVEGGVCLIQTVNAESPFALRYRWGDLTHETAFSAAALRTALLLVGFREASAFPVPPVFRYGFASAVRSLLWKGVSAAWRLALFAESGDGRGILTGNLIMAARR